MILGAKDSEREYYSKNQLTKNQLTYVLPTDAFVSSDDIFYVNGGQCSRYWVNTESELNNHQYARTTTTYINFAFCKKGDRITSNDGHQKYPLEGNTVTFSGVNLTIIPARK